MIRTVQNAALPLGRAAAPAGDRGNEQGMESFNRFSQWIGFGNRGVIADNDPIEQEKAMKVNDPHHSPSPPNVRQGRSFDRPVVQRGGDTSSAASGSGARAITASTRLPDSAPTSAAQTSGGDLSVRVTAAQFPYGGGDHQVFDVADGDSFGLGLFTHGQLGLAGGLQQDVGPGEECPAVRNEPGALVRAVQQSCAEMLLEPLDLAAQRRLGHVQVGRRPGRSAGAPPPRLRSAPVGGGDPSRGLWGRTARGDRSLTPVG